MQMHNNNNTTTTTIQQQPAFSFKSLAICEGIVIIKLLPHLAKFWSKQV
jgi:hypothetical protein